jgi:hypothetical protein
MNIKKGNNLSMITDLRKKAEELVKKKPLKMDSKLSEAETLKLIQELEIRQVELELQNEELRDVYKKTDEAREQAELAKQKYTELYDFAPTGYFTLTSDSTILDLNLSGAEMLGNNRQPLKSKRFDFFVSEGFRQKFAHFLKDVFDSKAIETCELSLSSADKQPIEVLLTGISRENGENCQVTAVNISKLKQAEDTLRKSKEQYRAITQSANDAIISISSEGIVVEWNHGAEKAFGYTEAEITGKNLSLIMPHRHIEQHQQGIHRVANGGEHHVLGKTAELQGLHKNGHEFPVELSLSEWETASGKFFTGIIRDTTERKLAEKNLRDNLLRQETILQTAMDGFWLTDMHGNLLEVNESYCRMSGYSSEELLSLNIADLVFNASTEELALHIQKVMAQGEDRFEYNQRRKDGSSFHVMINMQYQHLGGGFMVAFLQDITQRKQDENHFKLLVRAIEQCPISIVITDKNANIEYVNPKFTEATGYTFDEVISENARILQSGKQSQQFYKEFWNTILTGNDWKGEFQNKKKDGELFWEYSTISSIVNHSGDITHFIAVKEEITGQKKMIVELVEAKEKAEESDRLKSSFLANMSHEIRTPMNGILGFADLLREPGLSGQQQEDYLSIIEKSGARMLNIISDIIDISKVDSGQMKVKLSETNINDQIEFVSNFFRTEAEQKGIQILVKNTLARQQIILKTDKEKLSAILVNLMKNAIKFTKKGSIEIGCGVVETHGRASLHDSASTMEFYVRDTGIGIRPDQQKYIFDRFRQGSETLNKSYEGAGLGLSISKAYVEMIGGKIRVESIAGKGSTFFFTIPYEPFLPEEISTEKVNPADARINEIKKLKILIVEDDKFSEMLIERAVEVFSEKTFKAVNGIEAVQSCREHPDIDLVLMDIHMPEMDGYEAIRQIRKFNTGVIIISQTAYALEGDREKSMEAGCTDYIAKPIRKKDLIALIQKHFNLTEKE